MHSGAHGFAALLVCPCLQGDTESDQRTQETKVNGKKSHLTLFDTGPDSRAMLRNATAMRVPVDEVETVVLSHWHRDHSGGMLSFLHMRSREAPRCVVDLHPDRPIARGIAIPPTYETVIGRLPEDPTFELIEAAGGFVEKHAEGHAIADGTVYVSGVIPRVTPFEEGLPGGVRFVEEDGKCGRWTSEPVCRAQSLSFSFR